ncbi:MAG: FecR domain-containing protein [Candidatus Pseudobacter hemicellulosilyticus]|uniref:FecR domain-containing protein n=1 Tax=Candidatus Pseudobacter hemicellulosilyticus TaxID=3121375 RepID=A0AAJ6BDY0_9BACT|nr:MAG: FecR domain-containing protein [Pseudobacter sp.]
MNQYEYYQIEDFLSDTSFIEWVLDQESEQAAFWDNWLLDHPEREPIVQRARNILLSIQIAPVETALSEAEIQAIAAYTEKNAQPDVRPKAMLLRLFSRPWLRVAAILLVIAGTGALLYRPARQTATPGNTAAVTTTTQGPDSIRFFNNSADSKLLQLSDGSLIVLGPRSGVQYPAKFSGQTREVNLTGEAFFEVQADAQQPFLVYSHKLVTKVLGTSFTIRAFDNEPEIKVIVNTGKVAVYEQADTSSGNTAVTLVSNQQVIYRRQQSAFAKDTLTRPPMLSQTEAPRIFSFTNATVAEVIATLEEAYQVSIQYNKKYADMTITASLSRLPLDEKINMICKAINAKCTIEDGNISIE